MPMKMKAVFDGVSEKKTPDGRKVFKGVATSLALDRHREVVIPKGVNMEDFIENPVLMSQHEHRTDPIGTVLSLDPNDENIKFEFAFDESDPDAAKTMRKFENGTMRTFSIGFLPTKWVDQEELVDETGKMLDKVDIKVGGNPYTLDLTRYKATPRRLYTDWELLEISTVSIPANPEAHITRMAEGLIDEAVSLHPEAKSFIEEAVHTRMASLAGVLKTFEKEITEYQMNGLVEVHSTKIADEAWDADLALAHLAKWASSDGSGEKSTIAWGKYAKGFARFDSTKAESFGSYQLPHHDIRSGEFVAVRSGITAAMAVNLKAHAEEGEEGKAVHQHLAKHYADMGADVPEYGKSYTDEELTKIADGTWTKPVEPEVTASGTPVTPDPTSAAAAIALAKSIDAFREMLVTRAIGFNIKLENILESVSEVNRALATREVPAAKEPEPAGDAGKAVGNPEVIVQLKDALDFYRGTSGDPAN